MGSTLIRRQSIAELIKLIYYVHPDAKYVGMYDLLSLVMIRDPRNELIKSITLKHFDMFMDHSSFFNETQDPFFAKNLIAVHGDRWREMRFILSPAFMSSKMKSMFKLMSNYSIDFSKYLAQLSAERRKMEMKDVFMRYTNDVIATCAFGVCRLNEKSK
ncbi:hypothetical protein P5V15_005779 [Pogonomyrmex californicus]